MPIIVHRGPDTRWPRGSQRIEVAQPEVYETTHCYIQELAKLLFEKLKSIPWYIVPVGQICQHPKSSGDGRQEEV